MDMFRKVDKGTEKNQHLTNIYLRFKTTLSVKFLNIISDIKLP